ncbi:hypothetical protein H0H93_015426, partial [Arthromyces matolae]
APEEVRTTGEIEIRMNHEDTQHPLKALNSLFSELEEYEKNILPNQAKIAASLENIALQMRNMKSGIRGTAKLFIQHLPRCKKLVALKFTSASVSKPSSEQIAAIKALEGWETMLHQWKVGHLLVEGMQYQPIDRQDVRMSMSSVQNIEVTEHIDYMNGCFLALVNEVLEATIDDIRTLRSELKEVAAHVQRTWISASTKLKVLYGDPAKEKEKTVLYLEELNKYIMVLGHGSMETTPTTTPSSPRPVPT